MFNMFSTIISVLGAIAAILTLFLTIWQIVVKYRQDKRSSPLSLNSYKIFRIGRNEVVLKNYSSEVLTIINAVSSSNITFDTILGNCQIKPTEDVFIKFNIHHEHVKKSFIKILYQKIDGDRKSILIDVSISKEYPKVKSS